MAEFIPIDFDNDVDFSNVMTPLPSARVDPPSVLMSSNDSPAAVTPRMSTRDLKANPGVVSYNSLATELKSVHTNITEKLEPLGEKVDRILEVTEGLVEFVNGNCKTLERVLDQANAGVSSGPVSVIDVGVVLNNAIREEGEQTRWLIERAAQETRWFNAQCTMVVLLFIFALFALKDFHALWTPVFSTNPPVPPVCAPCRDTALPSMWDNYMSCARIFTEDTD